MAEKNLEFLCIKMKLRGATRNSQKIYTTSILVSVPIANNKLETCKYYTKTLLVNKTNKNFSYLCSVHLPAF